MFRLCSSLCFAALAGAGLFSLPVSAATLSVPSQYRTIQAAIDASSNGDTVLIADGTYTIPGDVNVDFHGKNITVRSASNDPTKTVIDCYNVLNGTVSTNPNGSLNLYGTFGFILQTGETNAAISGLTIQNAFMPEIPDVYNGGAKGAGIICYTAMTVENCILKNNTAQGGNGGGIYAYDIGEPASNPHPVIVNNCLFISNNADFGAGFYVDLDVNSVTVTNCTFDDNLATFEGGGAYGGTFERFHPLLDLTNDLFWDNTLFYASFSTSGNTGYGGWINATYCDTDGVLPGVGNIHADPLFVSATDFHLKPGSPCLGAGTAAGAPTTTLDGRTRPVTPSIGAYEAAAGTTGANQVRFSPRPGYTQRMVGGVFQGSHDNAAWTTLATVTTAPPAGQYSTLAASADPATFRYLRYLAPARSYGNVAEIEFDSRGVKLTGTAFGTAGSYKNDGNTFGKALDGSVNTFFDAPAPGSGDSVGIDRGQ